MVKQNIFHGKGTKEEKRNLLFVSLCLCGSKKGVSWGVLRFGIKGNYKALKAVHYHVKKIWHEWLGR